MRGIQYVVSDRWPAPALTFLTFNDKYGCFLHRQHEAVKVKICVRTLKRFKIRDMREFAQQKHQNVT